MLKPSRRAVVIGQPGTTPPGVNSRFLGISEPWLIERFRSCYAGGGDSALRRLAAISLPPNSSVDELLGPDIPRIHLYGKECAKCHVSGPIRACG